MSTAQLQLGGARKRPGEYSRHVGWCRTHAQSAVEHADEAAMRIDRGQWRDAVDARDAMGCASVDALVSLLRWLDGAS